MERLSYNQENKELFCKAVNAIIEQDKKDEEFSEAVKKVSLFESGFYYNYDKVKASLENVLEVFLPETSREAVSWLICETMPILPQKPEEGNCSDTVNDEEWYFFIVTPEDLYEFEWKKYENLTPVKKIKKLK